MLKFICDATEYAKTQGSTMPISTSPFLVFLQGCVAAMWGVLLEGALCVAGRTFYFKEDQKCLVILAESYKLPLLF